MGGVNMESWNLNGYTLEYDDDSHTYLVDGVIVPSVTQVLKVKFGGIYESVAPEVLKRAGERGTAIHKSIEDYCTRGIDLGTKEVRHFRFLKTYYDLKHILNEIPIIVCRDGVPVTAGRLDMVVDVGEDRAIADIKTTSTLNKEYLAYQLNLYRLGVLQCYKELGDISKLYGIHIREDKRKLVEIPINEGIAWDIIRESEVKE
jgi:hypothetical protein